MTKIEWRRIAGGLCLRNMDLPYAYVYVYDRDDVVDVEEKR